MSGNQPDIRQIKAARALLGWSQETLSEKSGVPLSTIKRIEASEGGELPNSANAEKIIDSLSDEGVEFLYRSGFGVRISNE